jgi:thiamine biosynthesis lipoprotein
MGTHVELIGAPGSDDRVFDKASEVVERIFEREEQRFSRFRPDSELSKVNSRAGDWVKASPAFARLTKRSVKAAKDTGGLFDPTILPALKAAGYDRDWSEVAGAGADPEIAKLRQDVRALMIKGDAKESGSWHEVEVRGNSVRFPAGTELDFGGIAKGWTVDLAVESVRGMRWAIVDAGGDLRIVGKTPEDGLEVAVEDPEARGVEAVRLKMGSGALATTSVTVRSWGPGKHHVIDPRTSLPAITGVLQASVWAPTCAQAEIWSKVALLTGPDILDRIPATLVMASGEIVTSLGAEEVRA